MHGLIYTFILCAMLVKPCANGYNIVGQQLPALLDVPCCVRLPTLFAQSLKLVNLLAPCKRMHHCWELLRLFALDGRTFSHNMEVHIIIVPTLTPGCFSLVLAPPPKPGKSPLGMRLISYHTVDIACITLSTIKMICPDLFSEEIPCGLILVKDHLS